MSSTTFTQSPGVFTQWPGERPSVSAAKEWFLRNEVNLVSDWAALKDGVAVRSLLQFDARPPPAALVQSSDFAVAGAITPAHVAARDVVIHQINSENMVRGGQRAAAMAELRNALFSALAAAMMVSAPLLLNRIRAAHVLVVPYAAWKGGPAAWLQLYTGFVTNGVSREEELDEHDDCPHDASSQYPPGQLLVFGIR